VSAAAGPGNARKVLMGAAIVVTTIAIIVVAILLIRGPGSDDLPPATTVSEAQELARLRAEALEAARTFYPRKDRAYAKGDIKLLEGIFVPGGEYERAVKQEIEDFVAKGDLVDTQSEASELRIVTLDRERAQIQFTNTVVKGSIKDAKTGRVKSTYGRGDPLTFRIYLVRLNDRWLVDALDTEDELRERGEL
jgi:hypothetical protein